jgi:type IV pilus assembly protein PilP
VALAGCGNGDMADLRQFVADSGKGLRGKIEPLPEVKPYDPFVYNAFDLPDPFKPRKLQPAKGGGGIQPDLNRRREPLEAYALENLKMVGTLEQGKLTYALIKAPDNTLHRVKIGNYMGQNFGIITDIKETEVKLTEIVQDSAGEWVEKAASILLAEEPSEQKK